MARLNTDQLDIFMSMLGINHDYQLAELSDIRPETISRLRTTGRQPRIETLQKLQSTLNHLLKQRSLSLTVSTDDLLTP